MFCLALSIERKAAYERTADLSSLPFDLAAKPLPDNIAIRVADGTRVVTIGELRDLLLTLGLDLTTNDALDWGTEYPHAAEDITRICELEQQLADLQLEMKRSTAE